MVATGSRFSDDLYILFQLDESNGDVYVEMKNEGETINLHGVVTWDD